MEVYMMSTLLATFISHEVLPKGRILPAALPKQQFLRALTPKSQSSLVNSLLLSFPFYRYVAGS